jgi:hypothetical protein
VSYIGQRRERKQIPQKHGVFGMTIGDNAERREAVAAVKSKSDDALRKSILIFEKCTSAIRGWFAREVP